MKWIQMGGGGRSWIAHTDKKSIKLSGHSNIRSYEERERRRQKKRDSIVASSRVDLMSSLFYCLFARYLFDVFFVFRCLAHKFVNFRINTRHFFRFLFIFLFIFPNEILVYRYSNDSQPLHTFSSRFSCFRWAKIVNGTLFNGKTSVRYATNSSIYLMLCILDRHTIIVSVFLSIQFVSFHFIWYCETWWMFDRSKTKKKQNWVELPYANCVSFNSFFFFFFSLLNKTREFERYCLIKSVNIERIQLV